MNRRYRKIQIRTMDKPASHPFKWLLGFVAFGLALSVTFADVGGDGVGNPYNGGYTDDAALENIFVLPESQSADGNKAVGEKTPILLKRR